MNDSVLSVYAMVELRTMFNHYQRKNEKDEKITERMGSCTIHKRTGTDEADEGGKSHRHGKGFRVVHGTEGGLEGHYREGTEE